MTAWLGSEYRYFGKLVLVPFRYFSIDTYRNIDIFDNTRGHCNFYKPFNCGFTNNEWDTCEIVTLAAFNYKTS